MNPESKSPPWLTFVDKASDDMALLRLLMLNPFNSEMSTFVNSVIDADPDGYAPSASDLHTGAHPD
jgi:hypothetical protein